MQRSFSRFPGRWPGIGLLLLRVAAGGVAMAEGAACLGRAGGEPLAVWLAGLMAIAGGASLVVGFLTPGGGVAAALAVAFIGSARLPAPFVDGVGALLAATVATSLVLLGPGALSLDARLFGRREIVFPHNAPGPSR
jgi:uncharacterized membrane protein YphA (DoxX/SURF4 family)